MGRFKILVTLSLCFGLSACVIDKVRMIVDVVNSYEQPTAVLASVCWGFPAKFNFMSELMKSKKQIITAQLVSDLKVHKFDPITTMIVIDLNCLGSRSILEQADENHVFSKPYRWLIIGNVDEFKTSTGLQSLNILLNSEVILAEKTTNSTFMLNFIYRIDTASSFILEEFGFWSAVDRLEISEVVARTATIMRRKDLKGKTIPASYVITKNKTRNDIHVTDRDLKTDYVAKQTYNILIPLYDFMNASRALVFTNTWGYYVNNSWNGMIGDIESGRAELCGTLSFMSLSRVDVVHYVTQPISEFPKFLFRDPSLSFQNNLFILPFRGVVWGCIGGLVTILVLIIYIHAKWETVKDEEVVMGDSKTLRPDVSDIGFLVISAITQQGNTNELKGSLGRLVTFIMFLIFLFLYTSYAANIVALLQSNSNQIRTLTDLLHSKLELGVENEPYNLYYFPTATEPVRKAIYENKILKVGYKPNFMSLEEGVKRLRNKDVPFAFHMHPGIGYKLVEELFHDNEKCDLHEINYFTNAVPWTCVKKSSPYKEIYKIGLNRLFEHGLNYRVSRIINKSKPVCNMRGGNFASVNMVDFHPVLLWMVYGMALSLFLLMVEKLLHRRQKKLEVLQVRE